LIEPKRAKGLRLTPEERLEVRRRISGGESFEQAAEAVRCTTKTVQRLLNAVGGVSPREKERSKLRLSLVEREEISHNDLLSCDDAPFEDPCVRGDTEVSHTRRLLSPTMPI